MNKPTKKRSKYNEQVLVALKEKHGYSIDYIRKSLRGDRVGFIPDKLKKEYKKLVKEADTINEIAKKALQKKANNLNQ